MDEHGAEVPEGVRPGDVGTGTGDASLADLIDQVEQAAGILTIAYHTEQRRRVAAEAAIVRLVKVIDEWEEPPHEFSKEFIAAWEDCVNHGDFERGRKEG